MGIRPVDMQIVMPKSAEAGKVGQDSARPDLQAQQFAQQLQKQVQVDQQHVMHTNKSEKDIDNEEKERKRKNAEKQEREKQRGQADARSQGGAAEQRREKRMIDISV